MNFSYKDVKYPSFIYVADHASAHAQLDPETIAVIKPADVPKSLKLYCPCGCGEILTINLMSRTAKAWRFSDDAKKGFSLWPSVWLDRGCKSHFILRHNIAWLIFGELPDEELPSYWDRLFGGDNTGRLQ